MSDATKLVAIEPLSPLASSKIRGQIAIFMKHQIDLANEVVLGSRDWNPTQARVFGVLLNKVVPDLSASYVKHEHDVKEVTDLSREELEAVARGINTINITSSTKRLDSDEKIARKN